LAMCVDTACVCGHCLRAWMQSELHVPGLHNRFLLMLNVLLEQCGEWRPLLAGQVQVNQCIEQLAIDVGAMAREKDKEKRGDPTETARWPLFKKPKLK
jgi:hypothetical protein